MNFRQLDTEVKNSRLSGISNENVESSDQSYTNKAGKETVSARHRYIKRKLEVDSRSFKAVQGTTAQFKKNSANNKHGNPIMNLKQHFADVFTPKRRAGDKETTESPANIQITNKLQNHYLRLFNMGTLMSDQGLPTEPDAGAEIKDDCVGPEN